MPRGTPERSACSGPSALSGREPKSTHDSGRCLEKARPSTQMTSFPCIVYRITVKRETMLKVGEVAVRIRVLCDQSKGLPRKQDSHASTVPRHRCNSQPQFGWLYSCVS